MTDPREVLGRATERFRETDREHELSREAVVEAVVAALRGGVPPAEVVWLSPFGATYVPMIAREHGVRPAPGGLKPRAKRSRGS